MMDLGGAKRQDKKLKFLLAGAGLLILILAALAGFLFWQYKTANDASDTSSDEAKAQKTQRVLGQVGELFILPTGEEPTVAQVQDTDKLKEQTFFDKAKNGDYLLVYNQAKLALLYRESEGKLVNVGPINTEDDAQQQTPNAGQ